MEMLILPRFYKVFVITVRLSGFDICVFKPSGVHPAGAARNLRIPKGFPMFPYVPNANSWLRAVGPAGIGFARQGRMVKTVGFSKVFKDFE